MLIIGAGGHATELLQSMEPLAAATNLFFYDDVTPDLPALLFGRFPVLRSEAEARVLFARDNTFALGLGGTTIRWKIAQRFQALGGQLVSVIAESASISPYDVVLGPGLNVMQNALISSSTQIGEGTLVNAAASVHHNTELGRYCVVSPGARVLGRCQVEDFCLIGANATILADIRVGHNSTIGAGAVVTRHVAPNSVVVGVPARPIGVGHKA
ncbi:NeuD/PglB/VioB family sugar acetyltransferase [Hymenobacter algoricola]|uniref:PglD N-terminal domain-containing protein n=1 Tax=Hymenobacter algoricola TaxID=486267 RepID=A0ABP7NPA2_9BACT